MKLTAPVLALLLATATGATVTTAAGTAAAATPLPANVALTQRSATAGRGDSAVTTPVLQGLSGLARPVSAAILADLGHQDALLAKAATQAHTTVGVFVAVAEQDERYLSFRIETSTYAAGAAHPLAVPTAVTYRRDTGRRLGFGDLFAGHVPAALAALSRQTRTLLPPLLSVPTTDADLLDGTKPSLADLGTITPRVTGVEVTFTPYQVAPYADGEPSLVVPWSALRGLTAVPLPVTVEPPPPYLGGYPTQVSASLGNDVGSAVAASTNAIVKARAKGGYRLTDAVVVYAQDSTYELVRLVPTTSPGAAVTLALVDKGKGLAVVDAQNGAAGCKAFPTAVRKAIRAGCR